MQFFQLHVASQRGMEDIVSYLLSHPSLSLDTNAVNEYGLTPLHFACIGGYVKVVELLLNHGANPAVRTDSEGTSLHLAASAGSHEICELLSHCGDNKGGQVVDLWAVDEDGESMQLSCTVLCCPALLCGLLYFHVH